MGSRWRQPRRVPGPAYPTASSRASLAWSYSPAVKVMVIEDQLGYVHGVLPACRLRMPRLTATSMPLVIMTCGRGLDLA
jgi:hypothetical protein